MTITHHPNLIQGTDEWLQARCGLLTASEMKLVITPKRKAAYNDKVRSHVYELAAQRITKYVEPAYVSDDMLRGQADEIEAKMLYAKHYADVQDMGFITNDKWGFPIGYSPDGLVGDAGLIECKSRRQKFQVQTMVEAVAANTIPDDFIIQVQTGLMVSERQWCDFISYCGGMHMAVVRVYPDESLHAAIIEAAEVFEEMVQSRVQTYAAILASDRRLLPTERKIEQEMFL